MSEVTKEATKPRKVLFQTKDINLSAYLLLSGYVIDDCYEENGKTVFGFIENDRKQREDDVKSFYNNKGGFLEYASRWRDLKSIVFNARKEKTV